MAAGWEIANSIPDRAYSIFGKWFAWFWEREVLGAECFSQLKLFARDLGTLVQASALPIDGSRHLLHAFTTELVARGQGPEDAMSTIDALFDRGGPYSAAQVLDWWSECADPKHRPDPALHVCRHCGAAQ